MSSSQHSVVVAGAGQGMGEAVARRFATQGSHVFLIGRTAAKLERVAAQIKQEGGSATPYPADLSLADSLNSFCTKLDSDGTAVDTVVCCVGEALIKPIADTTLSDWDHILSVNLRSVFILTQALLPALRRSHNPSLIYIASKVALRGYPHVTAYSAAKAGIVGFARSLAVELRDELIRVAVLCPGPVDTPMRRSATPNMPEKMIIDVQTIANTVAYLAGLPRGVSTGEVLVQSAYYD
jgi:NAD(P)-dependent dehydrogenase (short-subunit alcohol dehydrogenase family)